MRLVTQVNFLLYNAQNGLLLVSVTSAGESGFWLKRSWASIGAVAVSRGPGYCACGVCRSGSIVGAVGAVRPNIGNRAGNGIKLHLTANKICGQDRGKRT